MKIAIYQINSDRDTNRIAFEKYKNLEKYQGTTNIQSDIYDKVFAGEVECKSLEDIFVKFNTTSDLNFRSLSVSDIVEVIESAEIEQGFYFCDAYGFKNVYFDSRLADDVTNKENYIDVNKIQFIRIKEIETNEHLTYEVRHLDEKIGTIEISDTSCGDFGDRFKLIFTDREGNISHAFYDTISKNEQAYKEVFNALHAKIIHAWNNFDRSYSLEYFDDYSEFHCGHIENDIDEEIDL